MQKNKERLKGRINSNLRKISRQIITYDTLEETLNYLLESFYREFTCDLAAIILAENGRLVPKAWIGEHFTIDQTLHLELSACAPNLLKDALWWQKDKHEELPCSFREALKKEHLSTWYTVPLKNNNKSFGLCVIGFRNFVPLIVEADQIFVEFGQDVAVAMDLARHKERQKRKITGIEWVTENIFPGSSIEQVIEKVVERAGKGTQADGACVYLYDEENQYFLLNSPLYGTPACRQLIKINPDLPLHSYFPFIEQSGGNELTVPLRVNGKTIGMLFVSSKGEGKFSEDDLEVLKFVSDFVSMQIENARLYKYEFESKQRLETILMHQQELVKSTVEGEDIHSISKTISSMVDSSVLLYDRFFNPITAYFKREETDLAKNYRNAIEQQKQEFVKLKVRELWVEGTVSYSVWPIVGGKDVLGYLVVCFTKKKMDRILRITMDYVLHVYAIEFIKKKLVLDANEQVKESFVNQLFSETIEDPEKIIQYATLINWNLLEKHRVALLSFKMDGLFEQEQNLVMIESFKSWLWDQIKSNLALNFSNMIFSRKGDEFILIAGTIGENNNFWHSRFERIVEVVKRENPNIKVYLGVGGLTEKMEDYYYGYLKAAKAKNVVEHRYPDGGYDFYDRLGSYTILNNTSDQLAAELFVKKNLAPLIHYSQNNNVDLFTTLRTFLNHNGSLREASKELYIHRSTLEYRIERISELLGMDLDSADVRFELMMAYRLYNLFNFQPNLLL